MKPISYLRSLDCFAFGSPPPFPPPLAGEGGVGGLCEAHSAEAIQHLWTAPRGHPIEPVRLISRLTRRERLHERKR
jgi:hypothetical protein